MQVKIQNQNILITGATGGIGTSIVKSFDGDNNNLLIIGTNENKLNALSQELESSTKYLSCNFAANAAFAAVLLDGAKIG